MDVDQLKSLMAEHGETQADIARLLGISPDKVSKMMAGKRQLKVAEANRLQAYFVQLRDDGNLPHLLPIVGLVSAGAWSEGFEQIRGYMPSPDKNLSRHSFVVIIEGDSMDAVAKEGEAIIVDPQDMDLVSGKYYVVRNADGETTFKRYMEAPARLEPCSSNPAHTTIYPGRDTFTIVGRAKKKVEDL